MNVLLRWLVGRLRWCWWVFRLEEDPGSVSAALLEKERGGDFDWDRFRAIIDEYEFLSYFWRDKDREEEIRVWLKVASIYNRQLFYSNNVEVRKGRIFQNSKHKNRNERWVIIFISSCPFFMRFPIVSIYRVPAYCEKTTCHCAT